MKIIKTADFRELVTANVRKGMTYIEAVLQVCVDKQLDPEDMKPLIRGPMKDKIEAEARTLRMLKGKPPASLEEFM